MRRTSRRHRATLGPAMLVFAVAAGLRPPRRGGDRVAASVLRLLRAERVRALDAGERRMHGSAARAEDHRSAGPHPPPRHRPRRAERGALAGGGRLRPASGRHPHRLQPAEETARGPDDRGGGRVQRPERRIRPEGYDEEFGIPECTSGDGCFTKVNQDGETSDPPFPTSTAELEAARKGTSAEREKAAEALGWGVEISLDIEAAHATCQGCDIVLVEADSTAYENLETAEHTAAELGADEISNSWGGPEAGETPSMEAASPFNHPGIVITASAGDDGYLSWDARYSMERGYADSPPPHPTSSPSAAPASPSPPTTTGAKRPCGTATGPAAGAAASSSPPRPGSSRYPTGRRSAVAKNAPSPMSSADADPYTGFAVHDTSTSCEYQYEEAKVKHVEHWCIIGGTSLASPVIAAVVRPRGRGGRQRIPS